MNRRPAGDVAQGLVPCVCRGASAGHKALRYTPKDQSRG